MTRLLNTTLINLLDELNIKPNNSAVATAFIGKPCIFFATSNRITTEQIEKAEERFREHNVKICNDLTLEEKQNSNFKVKRRNADGNGTYEVKLEKLKELKEKSNEDIEKEFIGKIEHYIEQRWTCTERKILAAIEEAFKGQVKGPIDLYTQFSPCHECTILIEEFREKYKGKATLKVYDYSQLVMESTN